MVEQEDTTDFSKIEHLDTKGLVWMFPNSVEVQNLDYAELN